MSRLPISRDYLERCLLFVFLFGFISLGAIGGCNNNNGGGQGDGGVGEDPPESVGEDPPESMFVCTPLEFPCASVTVNSDQTVATCLVSSSTCGVDLVDVAFQVANDVDLDTTMWIQAWGGDGGNVDTASQGGIGGYAQTITNANTLSSMNNNSTVIYYFLGSRGHDGGNHCGGGGGASTIVTFEDLTQNPATNPTGADVLLVAGAAGGGSGGNGEIECLCDTMSNIGSDGGVAISDETGNKSGAGGSFTSNASIECTDGGGDNGIGGKECISASGDSPPSVGTDGFGGLGNKGGDGQDCTAPGAVGFINTSTMYGSVELSFTAGQGGSGGGGGNCCDAGGGGGGGGYGGGGGGGHGNTADFSMSGGGGGSFAIKSDLSTDLAPTIRPTNPCGSPALPDPTQAGCLQIQFCLTEDCFNL